MRGLAGSSGRSSALGRLIATVASVGLFAGPRRHGTSAHRMTDHRHRQAGQLGRSRHRLADGDIQRPRRPAGRRCGRGRGGPASRPRAPPGPARRPSDPSSPRCRRSRGPGRSRVPGPRRRARRCGSASSPPWRCCAPRPRSTRAGPRRRPRGTRPRPPPTPRTVAGHLLRSHRSAPLTTGADRRTGSRSPAGRRPLTVSTSGRTAGGRAAGSADPGLVTGPILPRRPTRPPRPPAPQRRRTRWMQQDGSSWTPPSSTMSVASSPRSPSRGSTSASG